MRKKLESSKVAEQTGRSLVELLGVLAVAGILAVAGLYGVGYAMEKWRENETLDRYAKVVAGARTSRILQNEGYYTKYDYNHNPRDEFVRQHVGIKQVISNVGDDDDYADDERPLGYLLAPQKGPYNRYNQPTNGTDWSDYEPKEVEIWVDARTPSAFTVHAKNLPVNTCKRIVQSNLGYNWAFGATTDYEYTGNEDSDVDSWIPAPNLHDDEEALALCQAIAGSNGAQELVLWFGGTECIKETNCPQPKQSICPSGNGAPECDENNSCGNGEYCSNYCCYSENEPDETDPITPGEDECICPEGASRCGEGDTCVCCESGEWCDVEVQRCISGCPSGNEAPECENNDECETNEICNGGCCVSSKCNGRAMCSSSVECPIDHYCSEQGCCEPLCDGQPTCKADEDCGEGYACNNGCCVEAKTYCAADKRASSVCTEGKTESGTTVYTCVYSTTCEEYKTTGAELMKDPTPIVYPDFKEYRVREIPMVGELEGKYPYCALVINGKCALVSYCDDEPTNVGELLQICGACSHYDPITHTCVGNNIISHEKAKAFDGEKVLYHYFRSTKNCVTPDDCLIDPIDPIEPIEPIEPESCYDPNDCPAGTTRCPDGSCQSNAWFDCSKNCTYINACGYTRPRATACCPGSWNGPSTNCSSVGHRRGCFGSGSIGGECCARVCYDGSSTGKYCCLTQADAQKGRSCCGALGGTWTYIQGRSKYGTCENLPATEGAVYTSIPEIIIPETTTPSVSTTVPEETPYSGGICDEGYEQINVDVPDDTTPPREGCTLHQLGSQFWCCPISSTLPTPETTSPTPETTTPETTTPETTTPETTTPDPRKNHQCYDYCRARSQ